jgi:F-type H+-transporting ATPase subunit gamma
MATLRELKGRIGSVASSEKITGAMKMISSAKMHKAEGALRRLVPFRSQVQTIIANLLSSDADFSSPLILDRPVQNVAVVVWGSDDGLCGAYNVNIFKVLLNHFKELRERYGAQTRLTVIPVGSKMTKNVSKLIDIEVENVEGIDSKSDGQKVVDFTLKLQQDFLDKKFDKVDVVYMNFKSVSRQRPVSTQLLPVVQSTFVDQAKGAKAGSLRPYLFEPSPERIFNTVLPMYLMATTQEIFTQNRASESAARVMAMQSANDNAKKLLDQLQLEYNKLRQQSITTELLDIVGGQVKE